MADAPLADVLVRLAAAMGEDVTAAGDVVSGRVMASGGRRDVAPRRVQHVERAVGGLRRASRDRPGQAMSGRRLGPGYEWRL